MNDNNGKNIAYFHLPGLFEFFDFYKIFLPLFYSHGEYFYDWCKIGSIYGSKEGCLWGGGRISDGRADTKDVISLIERYGISSRLTFSNSLIDESHLSDRLCNSLCDSFNHHPNNGVIISSDILLNHIRSNYPNLYFVSSTTKVITDFDSFKKELDREEFKYIVPDFRLNKSMDKLKTLSQVEKDKVEFLVNECCYIGCKDRKACYESVSKLSLSIEDGHKCHAPHGNEGYKFSRAMENPSFISMDDIKNVYLPLGFENFKIEGRGLGSALLLEFILYYMTKPEHQLKVREEIYLDSMLDLF